MTAAKKLQEPTTKKLSKVNGPKAIGVLLQNLGGKWFAFWELNGEIYYQVCPLRIVR